MGVPRWAPAARRAPAAHLPALRPEGPAGWAGKEKEKKKKSWQKKKKRKRKNFLPYQAGSAVGSLTYG